MKRRKWGAAAATLVLVVLSQASWAQAPERQTGSKRWITGAVNEGERFQRIETYLRGFDQPMWEVGERYEKLYAALVRGNLELASYHWAKIKLTIENGTMKRPARRASADEFLLIRRWNLVNEALESGDPASAWRGFERARSYCIQCHEAEGVSYMNDQPMFTDLVPIPNNTVSHDKD
jgi:cytochrome c1